MPETIELPEVTPDPPSTSPVMIVNQTPLSNIGAGIGLLATAVMFISTFLPVFSLSGYGYFQEWSMPSTPDSGLFVVIALLLGVLSAVRFATDHTGIRVAILSVSALSVLVAFVDAVQMQQTALQRTSGSGFVFAFGPALFLAGAAGLVVLVSACMVTSRARAQASR